MQDAAAVWTQALPKVMDNVTGRGVWAALNAARPVALEDGILVLGLPHKDGELAGHLRLPNHSRVIEHITGQILGQQLRVRIIEGTTSEDYEIFKRRELERRRLQEAGMERLRKEASAKTNWDTVYDALSRRYAAMSNKSLPQNRGRFFDEAVELVAEARRNQETFDEAGERNFARCLERVSQYSEVPSPIVAVEVLRRVGELA
ncbi:hypothetical protein EON79_00325 [bacterium]|nr:MAG: hypothetical protein EON79_00325 [bacterium]